MKEIQLVPPKYFLLNSEWLWPQSYQRKLSFLWVPNFPRFSEISVLKTVLIQKDNCSLKAGREHSCC